MDAQNKVLKQISIRINEYVNGDITLKPSESHDFSDQPNHVYAEEVFPYNDPRFNNLLGYYILMPKTDGYGKVYLAANNLEKLFWKLFIDIKKFVPRLDKNSPAMNTLAKWVVAKTYWHQHFHYLIDTLRQTAGAIPYDFNDQLSCRRQEALAAAYAYRQLQAVMDDKDYPDMAAWFLKMAFRYTAPGFKDWFIYLDDGVFWATLLEIIGLSDHADYARRNTPLIEQLQSLLVDEHRYTESVNHVIGNQADEMGKFLHISELFPDKHELYLMWLTTFKWHAVDIIGFLLSLPLNGFSIHFGITQGDVRKSWHHWMEEHTDSADKQVIVDMPKDISRENLYFLLDGEQRFTVLFLLFFILAIKNGNPEQFLLSDSSAKLMLVSRVDNSFLIELLVYLQQGGDQPKPTTAEQKNLLAAVLVIQQWLNLNQPLDDCYVFLIDYHVRESENVPFKYTDKHVRAHKLINCSIY